MLSMHGRYSRPGDGQAHAGGWRGGGGEARQRPFWEGSISTLRYMDNLSLCKQLNSPGHDYSCKVSSRWAFRAHLNVNLLFCSFMNGDSSFQAYGKAYSVVFLKVSVLGCGIIKSLAFLRMMFGSRSLF